MVTLALKWIIFPITQELSPVIRENRKADAESTKTICDFIGRAVSEIISALHLLHNCQKKKKHCTIFNNDSMQIDKKYNNKSCTEFSFE